MSGEWPVRNGGGHSRLRGRLVVGPLMAGRACCEAGCLTYFFTATASISYFSAGGRQLVIVVRAGKGSEKYSR